MRSADFAAGVGATSSTNIGISSIATDTVLIELDILNVANAEKVVKASVAQSGSSGAGNTPVSYEVKGKWANTSNAISRIDVFNGSGTGDYAVGSEMIVYGHN